MARRTSTKVNATQAQDKVRRGDCLRIRNRLGVIVRTVVGETSSFIFDAIAGALRSMIRKRVG